MKEVLLWQDVNKLGKRGEVVKVADGYARNFLFPRKLGTVVTKQNLKELEYEKKRSVKKEENLKTDRKQIAETIEKTSCTIEVKANQDGTLFGSVTPQLIIDALKRACPDSIGKDLADLTPQMIELETPIKELGVYRATIRLHQEITAACRIWVVEESDKT